MKSNQLVCQYLENIARKALEKHQQIIKKYVKGRHGIYALYRKNKLYYVGLATNLRSRLGHHLRDRHAGVWDSFSVYLTLGDQHLHEIEALLLRIIDRKGNKQKGKFGYADDLRRRFRNDLKRERDDEIDEILGSRLIIGGKDAVKKDKAGKKGERKPALAPYVNKRFHIRFEYKGKLYVAHVRRGGIIVFASHGAEAKRLQGKVYTSPSLAAQAVTKRPMNGWVHWKYERAPGDWAFIDNLRK